jgi:hypothetical protein
MQLMYVLVFVLLSIKSQVLLPVELPDRKDLSKIKLSPIGDFGLIRKARSKIPAHYHTGIDIKRPNNNYSNEPIFPIAKGKVISKRSDGPYANIIIEHEFENIRFWTLYEHISGIKVKVNDSVSPDIPIARFMNKEELNKNGWQFDHFHLEILKVKPLPLKPIAGYPERFFKSYSLVCFSIEDLNRYYFNPMEFLQKYFK